MKRILAADLKGVFTLLDLNPMVFADGSWTVLDAKPIPHPPRCA
jgi:hypothetical protein